MKTFLCTFCASYFQFLLGSDNEGTPWYSETQEEMPIPGDTLTELNVTVSPSFLPVINSIASKTVMYGSIIYVHKW